MVIAEPPLNVGAVKATDKLVLAAVIAVIVGADATTPKILAVNIGCVIE